MGRRVRNAVLILILTLSGVACGPAASGPRGALELTQQTATLAYNAAALSLTGTDLIAAVWIEAHPERVGDSEKLVMGLQGARDALAEARRSIEAGKPGGELWAALGRALRHLDAVRALAAGTGIVLPAEVEDSLAVVRELVRANGGGG